MDEDNVIPLHSRRTRPSAASTAEELLSEFEKKHERTMRYVPERACWFEFKGHLWVRDHTAVNKAVTLLADIGKGRSAKERGRIDSHPMMNGVERLARSSPVFVAPLEMFDAEPLMLNTPGGIVDLRRGSMRPAAPEDYCTKSTAVAPDFAAACPRWDEFLRTVADGDEALVGYLMRVLGYCLTGSTKEQCLFFLYGTGANGKSVLLNTVQNILADYAATAALDAFTASKFDKHAEALACLRGARLVLATETEESKGWDEAKVKMITGGDKIRARFMNKDSFEYRPSFKLAIAGNHKPSLKSVDEANARRQQIIPFAVTIPRPKRNLNLVEELCAEEGPAILAAMIRACMEWNAGGLCPPPVVAAATDKYLADEDTFAGWVSSCCVLDPAHRARSSTLYAAWKAYAEQMGERPGTNKNFKARLEGKYHLKLHPHGDANYWLGITTVAENDARSGAYHPAPYSDTGGFNS